MSFDIGGYADEDEADDLVDEMVDNEAEEVHLVAQVDQVVKTDNLSNGTASVEQGGSPPPPLMIHNPILDNFDNGVCMNGKPWHQLEKNRSNT